MCARTTLTITPDDLKRIFGFAPPPGYRPRYNICPTQEQLALTNTGTGVALVEYRWGLVPWWAEDPAIGNRMINARAETITEKSAYREAFSERRCLVIVDGFYEWQATAVGKRPYRVTLQHGEPFTIAGVWDRWRRATPALESCAVITTSANEMTPAARIQRFVRRHLG